eukprot:TRINITY_DN1693_c2_g1_i10.p1 TRINITY_DN1693_c2_g1~~TRINITY_DN1693_c2_g1_i10.p1  ORF type:complete len:237 (+),score=55.89 TRINITY_DN1693_c2_g1_i10:102-713(+)
MAAAALSGWQLLSQQQRQLQGRPSQADGGVKQTRFAHINRLPAAQQAAAEHHREHRHSQPSVHSDTRQLWQQPPLQGRMRPRRTFHETESRSGSEQGLTPDVSPRDPSPKPPPPPHRHSALGGAAVHVTLLPAPSGDLRSLNPAVLGLGGAASAAALRAADGTGPSSSLYQRRMSQPRVGDTAPKPYGGRTGHSVWGRRRRNR